MKRLVAQGLRAGFGGVVPSWLVGGLVFLLGVMRPSGAEATILPSFEDTEVDLLRGPPRPNYESTDRYLANAAAERHTLAALAGAPFVPRVVCDPSCRVASVGALGLAPLAAVTAEDAAVREAFAKLPVAGELARAEDLRLVVVERHGDTARFVYQRGEGDVACDCNVTLDVVAGRGIVRASAAKLLGYAELAPQRSTRGEARDAAARQLVADAPRFEIDEAQRSYLSEIMVVPVGDVARLVHRFAMRLGGLPYAVDVDDETLEVVRVRPDPRFDRTTRRVLMNLWSGEIRTVIEEAPGGGTP